MGLETGTTIAQLVSSNPAGGDPTNQGDDHLRLIKTVLKYQFPGSGGNGFSKVIFTNETELNYSRGLSSNIQDQLDTHTSQINALGSSSPQAGNIPVGSKMFFFMSSAPSGWVQDTSKNDYMLRVVSSGGGQSGGADSPISNDKVPTHTHTAIADSNTHDHNFTAYGGDSGKNSKIKAGAGGATAVGHVDDDTHTHTVTVNENAGSTWSPKYVNTILATKV